MKKQVCGKYNLPIATANHIWLRILIKYKIFDMQLQSGQIILHDEPVNLNPISVSIAARTFYWLQTQ